MWRTPQTGRAPQLCDDARLQFPRLQECIPGHRASVDEVVQSNVSERAKAQVAAWSPWTADGMGSMRPQPQSPANVHFATLEMDLPPWRTFRKLTNENSTSCTGMNQPPAVARTRPSGTNAAIERCVHLMMDTAFSGPATEVPYSVFAWVCRRLRRDALQPFAPLHSTSRLKKPQAFSHSDDPSFHLPYQTKVKMLLACHTRQATVGAYGMLSPCRSIDGVQPRPGGREEPFLHVNLHSYGITATSTAHTRKFAARTAARRHDTCMRPCRRPAVKPLTAAGAIQEPCTMWPQAHHTCTARMFTSRRGQVHSANESA